MLLMSQQNEDLVKGDDCIACQHKKRHLYLCVLWSQNCWDANLVIIEGLSGLHYSLDDLGQVSRVEQVVRLGGGRQQLFGNSPVHLNAALADLLS